MSKKPWLKHYPAGVPAEVDVAPVRSLNELLDAALKSFGARTATHANGKQTSYAELDVMAARLTAWLQSRGVKKGDRVALMMPNVLPFVAGVIATLRAGATVVTVNPMYTPRELAHQLTDSGADTIVILDAFAATLEATGLRPENVIVVKSGLVPEGSYQLPGHVDFVSAVTEGASLSATPVEVGPDDLAFLQYTGGTTGVSKGAMLKHSNVVANIVQLDCWTVPAIGSDSDRVGRSMVVMLPMYHIFALTFCLLYGIKSGLQLHLIANPRDMAGSIKALAGHKLHVLPAVNTLFAGLMAHPDFKQLDLSELRLAVGGGAAVHQVVAERWIAATGKPICEGYGLSETSPVASVNLPTLAEWTGTIGLPVPNTEIAIRDDDNRDVPMGERGEICIRGPQVMAGYWQRPDETAKVMTEDGFFKSGDIGVMDERGFVKIVDRKKDMILVSGFNVFPNEIEDIVARLEGVAEVAVIGVPDEKSGEVPKAYVVRSNPDLSEADVVEHCRKNLTPYKVPRHVAFIDALPKSTVGKVLRRELRG